MEHGPMAKTLDSDSRNSGSNPDAPTTQTFCVNDFVLYVPMHAKGNVNHPDCEAGIVTSTNDHYIFVRYGTRSTSQATRPRDLLKL